MGLDVSKLDKELDRLDKKLDALIKKGEKTEKAFETMFKGASAKNLLDHLDKVQSKISDISKLKDPMKWDSKSLVGYIDQVNRLLRTIEKANTAQGATPIKIINMEDLMAAKKELQTMLREVKALEKAQAQRTTSRNQTYTGAMRYSANANTLEKERQAIENLKVARDKLKQSDADYATKLNALNEAIKRHEKSLKDATKTDKDRADEAAKSAKKIADAQAKYDSISRRERYKAYTTSYEGAIKTSDRAKTLAQEIQAVKNLEAARAKLNKTDANYQKKLDDINARILQHNKNIQQATAGAKDLEKAHSSLGTKIASVFSIQAIRGYINQMIKVRGEMELQQRSLQAILQNKAAANEVWQKTIDLAVHSPFRIKNLVTYTKQLAAYRVESEKLYDTNKMLADVSAGLGVDMNRLILAFGQVKSANFLRGIELRQFTEAGIPMLDELAKLYQQMEGATVTAADVFDRISKRMVLFEDVEEVFKRMTAAGGTFYRMQEIQSETLKGQISNLKDSVDIMLNSMGKDMNGVLKKSVKSVKFLVDNYQALIPVLKAIIAALALYKINTFQASSATLMYARNLGVAKASASGLGAIWATLRVSLNKFKIALGETTAMLASNPWILLAAAIVTAAIKLNQFRKELEEVDKKYGQLLDKQGDVYLAFRQAGQKGDLEEQIAERRKQLQALVDMAKNEYGLVIDINVGKIDESKLEEEFNKIRQKMIDLNAFSASFSKEMIKSDKLSKWYGEDYFGLEEGLYEDIQDLGNSYEKLYQEMINKSGRTVEILRDQWDDLTDAQQKAVENLEKPIQGDESFVDYVNRLKDAYTTLLELKDVKNNKISRFIRSFNRDVREANVEFKLFANRFREEVNGIADEKEKIEFLDVSIGAMADEKKWSEFEENYIRRLAEQEFGITFVPKTATPEELKNWQKSYNSLFKDESGFREITAAATSQSQVVERLNGTYEALADKIKKIETAGEDSVLAGGAYEGENLGELKRDLEEVKQQLDWFGAQAQKDDKKESASIKILQKRINLLKEVNKKYLELEKTFDAVTAKEKVMEAYSDTFREAFEGTGVDLDMYKIMTQAIVDSKKVGEDAGSSFSEGMLVKLKELEVAGTYIRSFSDDLVEEIKKAEGFRAKAYQDAGGVWTQGYGETQGIEKDKEWTEEFAAQRLQTRLTEDYAAAVNKVLDANRDLIVTQEQYNALVDLAYQGGGRTVKNLVNYAKDVEQGASYIERISKKIKETMGEEAASRFGETFVNSFKEAETIQERMAMLLQTMNLTIKGKINKDWYEGMQARSDKRAAMFSGDLDVANQLETVLVRIAGMDFTTTEGMVEALGKLKEIAEKEGPEAKNILSQAISGLEAEIGLRVKKEEDKDLKAQVQELFDQYDLSVELKKLNIPSDLAKSLFDVDYLDLEGLKKAVQDQEAKFIGTDMEDEYKKFLEKIDDMEDKASIERMKTYVKYLQEGMSERVKLKIEEMRKLKEIEESEEFTPEQKERIKQGVSKEAKAEQQKLEWEDFQGTEMYTMMFDDIEFMGTKALEVLKNKLEELKASLSDLPASEVKEIINQISRIEDITIERNPFASMRDAMKEVRELQAKGRTEKALQEEFAVAEAKRQSYQEELDAVNLILSAKENEIDLNQQSKEWQEENKEYLEMQRSELERQAMVLSTLATGQEMVATNAKNDLDAYADARKSLEAVANQWNTFKQLADSAWGSAKTIMESLGVESDSLAMMIGDTAMNMVDLIFQAVQFHLQLQLMTVQAQLLGVAMNTALGPIGWIVLALQAVATLLSAIFSAKDKALQKEIDGYLARAEKLHEKYEELSDAIDSAYDASAVRQLNKEIEKTIKLEIKAIEAAIAAEKAQKASKIDWDWVAEQEKAVKDLYGTLNEEHDNYIERWGGFGSEEARFDFIESMTQAWLDSFKETGDGLDGLEEKWDEYFDNLAMKQMALRVSKAAIDEYLDMWDKYVSAESAGGEDLTEAEAQDLKLKKEQLLKGLSEKYTSLAESLGITPTKEGSGLSALQKGIQGITADQAEILTAYWNSVRGYTASIDSKMDLILANMGVGTENNPMLEQLISQTSWLSKIHGILEDVASASPRTFKTSLT